MQLTQKKQAVPSLVTVPDEEESRNQQAKALADLVSRSAKQLNKDKEEEVVHVDQGSAIKTITLAALPNDCRWALAPSLCIGNVGDWCLCKAKGRGGGLAGD